MHRAKETQVGTTGLMSDGMATTTGREITDTTYNTDGWVADATDPYFANGAPGPTYVQAQLGQVPSHTQTLDDQAGRKVATTQFAGTVASWQTTYSYGGNFTGKDCVAIGLVGDHTTSRPGVAGVIGGGDTSGLRWSKR